MKSYLSLIRISARIHRRQNRMTIRCIAIAVFLVTGIFSMTEMWARQETARLVEKHGIGEVLSILTSQSFRSLFPMAAILFLFVLCAGVFMIAGSMNASVAQRTQFFGMLRCIGMSRRQVIGYVRLEALDRCRIAIPAGLCAGTAVTWLLCAVLKYGIGGEWAAMPQFGISLPGLVSGIAVGILTVLIAAGRPAKTAASVSPAAALSAAAPQKKRMHIARRRIETALGIRHAVESKKNLFLMIASFALSIILFLGFSVIVDLVNCLLPQSAAAAEIEIYAEENQWIDSGLRIGLEHARGVERVSGRRAVFDVEADGGSVDLISFDAFDLEALKKDGILKKSVDLAPVLNEGAALAITRRDIPSVSVLGQRVPVAGKTLYDPFSSDGSIGEKTTLILSDAAFERLTGISDYTMLFLHLSDEASEADTAAIRTMADGYGWTDNRENDTRGTYLAFLVCGCAFLGIIALVTVLNIRNSVSMSVEAKIRQYGAMRAVGMSRRQVERMIRAETLTYAVLGCLAGTVIGLVFGKWLFDVLITAHFPCRVWRFPTGDLLIILAFFVLSFAAGIRAPIRRLRELSVTETIGRM